MPKANGGFLNCWRHTVESLDPSRMGRNHAEKYEWLEEMKQRDDQEKCGKSITTQCREC